MQRLLTRTLRTVLCVGVASHSAAATLTAQAGTTTADIRRGPWEFAMQVGLTSFGVDQSAPGSMTTLGIGRRVSDRFTVGFEGGLGTIETTGVCRFGNSTPFECAQSSDWPSIGLDTRFVVLDVAGSASRWYLVAQVLAHGPDLVASYDLGMGLSLRAVIGADVGLELRHRFGYDGASGGMYFFRISR
jgi:hypothetical protein